MKTLPTVVLALIGTLPMPAVLSAAPSAVAWHDVTSWGVEGRLWEDEERLRWFDRFPAAAEKTVPPDVWTLSRDSAGMAVRFETDAQTIRVRMKLLNEKLARPNMPATGVSGLDLYARDTTGRWRWVAVTKPEKQEFEADLIPGLALAPGRREYLAYLPLYNGVESLAIGVPEGAAFQRLAPRGKPIVFYGTSITHGACASRPGMAHVAILGRRLERPVANVGFSGNGRMDAAVGDLLARVDAACYVIDCLPNMDAKLVRERCAPLVKQLRAARPAVPIVLVEDRRFTNEWILPAKKAHHDANHAALREAFDALRRDGVGGLFYLQGDGLLGDDGEGAVDASHPTDLGFMRQADAFEPVLREALQEPSDRASSGAK
jgi:hypothetical protein